MAGLRVSVGSRAWRPAVRHRPRSGPPSPAGAQLPRGRPGGGRGVHSDVPATT